jgi:hypothetical protein
MKQGSTYGNSTYSLKTTLKNYGLSKVEVHGKLFTIGQIFQFQNIRQKKRKNNLTSSHLDWAIRSERSKAQ